MLSICEGALHNEPAITSSPWSTHRAEPAGRDVRLQPAAADPLRRADGRVHRRQAGRVRPAGAEDPRHLHHRHDLPRRPAGPAALHGRPDGPHLRSAGEARRPPRRHPPDRVLPLHEERPRDARPLPRAGPPLSRMHRLDPRRQGRLPPGPRGRAEGDRHAHQLLRLPHLPEAEVQEPPGVHGPLLRGGRRGLRGRRPPALPPGRHHPGRHRRLRPAVRRAADADERAGARDCRSRSACATRWASA